VDSQIHEHHHFQKTQNFTSFYALNRLQTGHRGAKIILPRPIASLATLQQKSAAIFALLALRLPVTLLDGLCVTTVNYFAHQTEQTQATLQAVISYLASWLRSFPVTPDGLM
jgi:hypothetical protein